MVQYSTVQYRLPYRFQPHRTIKGPSGKVQNTDIYRDFRYRTVQIMTGGAVHYSTGYHTDCGQCKKQAPIQASGKGQYSSGQMVQYSTAQYRLPYGIQARSAKKHPYRLQEKDSTVQYGWCNTVQYRLSYRLQARRTIQYRSDTLQTSGIVQLWVSYSTGICSAP
jgi:hypothetical protein